MIIKKINCPSCGSNSVFKLNETTLKCNYCQTEFIIDKNLNKNQPLKPIPYSNKTYGKLIFFMFGFFIFISMIIFILFVIKGQKRKTYTTNSDEYWKPSGTEALLPIHVENNDYVISLIKYHTSKLDSSIIRLKIIEPVSKNIIKDTVFFSGTWNKLTFKTNIQYFSSENLFYTIVNDTGFYVYDIPSLKLKNSHFSLSRNHKELAEGISNIQKDYYTDLIVFKDISNNPYYYDIKNDSMFTMDIYELRFRKNKFEESGVFFTQGEHPFLTYAVKQHNFYDKYTIPMSDTNYMKKQNELNFHKIKSVKLLSTKRFYQAKICGRYEGGLIFAYKETPKPGSTIYLSYVDKNGTFKWNHSDTLIQKYLDDGKNLKYFKPCIYKNKLILNIQNYPQILYCMDIEKGKPLWYFHSWMSFQ